jgi:nucleotide-binding universal stress UspA family protein
MSTPGLTSVVAASDLSDGSDTALQTAAALAAAADAELHVAHCIPQPVFPYWEGTVPGETREEWIRSARIDVEWQVRRVLDAGERLVKSIHVSLGEPARKINARVAEVGAQLIVVGPHEPRAAFDDLLGSTADRLIRSSEVPCLITNRPVVPPLRRVLLPTDFSEPARHALRSAIELLGSGLFVGGEGAEPSMVEILFVSAFALPSSRAFPAQPRLLEQVEEAKRTLPPDLRLRLLPRILSAQFPADGIRHAAERMEADLIVMGTHGYGTLGRALIGSVASTVARTLSFPVLLVPPPSS